MRNRLILLLLLLVIVLAFPIAFNNSAVTTIAFLTILFAAAATAWNIFAGYTGYIALGHAAFFGTGAYVMAILCQRWHLPGGYLPFALLPLAGLIAAALAIPLGVVVLRTRGHTFVVITIAIFFIAQLLAYNLRGLTNGSTGLSLPIPLDWSGDFYNLPFYYVGVLVLVVALAASWWIRNSKFGLGLLAIRDDEDRARGLGVNTGLSKLLAFAISAFFVGMLGALWTYWQESVSPPFAFDALFDVAIALMVFLGGVGTLAGPILGAVLLEPAQQLFALYAGQSGWYLVLYGALFLVIILFLPEGIVTTVRKRWMQRAGRSGGADTLASGSSTTMRVRPVAASTSEGGSER